MSAPVLGHLVECQQCHARTIVTDGTNVHDALNCRCCGDDHTHDVDGMTPEGTACRPLIITPNAVVVLVAGE